MPPKRWIRASLLTMIAAAPVVGTFASTNSAFGVDNQTPVAQLAEAVTGDDLDQRNSAAEQLVNRNTPEAADQIRSILRTSKPDRGPIAIARAIAKSPNPDPTFIDDLGRLLGADAAMTDAAAAALVHYDGHPEVLGPLKQFADSATNGINVRAKVIRAMGSLVDQQVAQYLVGLLDAPNQNPVIANAATDSLGELTGINSYQNNIQPWQQWWGGVKGLTRDQFKAQILDTRFKQLKERYTQLGSAASNQMEALYYSLKNQDSKKAIDQVVQDLGDRVPEIRMVGAVLVNENQPLYVDQSIQKKLLTMIQDPDDTVRLEVVKDLLIVNNPDAFSPLLAQLKVEQNLQIRVTLVQAIGKLENPAAIDPILDLLHDKQPDMITAAARVLAGNMGLTLREKSPAKADKASADLRKIVDDNTDVPGTNELRAACVAALATLKDKQSLKFFMLRVVPAESPEVRRAALRGLGNLGDTNAEQAVADQVDDPDETVRLEAAKALQSVATTAQVEHIFAVMTTDHDKSVRDALWGAFFKLYSKQKPDDIHRWVGRLDDKDQKIATLQKLADVLATAHDDRGVAETEQDLADVFMQVQPQRATDAIAELKKALLYWSGQKGGDASDRLDAIIGTLLDDELIAGKWSDATSDAMKAIKLNPIYQDTVGPRIKNKADDLVNGDHPDLEAAKTLIDFALKMDPPLTDRYSKPLRLVQDQIKQKQKQAVPPG